MQFIHAVCTCREMVITPFYCMGALRNYSNTPRIAHAIVFLFPKIGIFSCHPTANDAKPIRVYEERKADRIGHAAKGIQFTGVDGTG